MVTYTYDVKLIEIKEMEGEKDFTFHISAKTDEMRQRIKQVRSFFNENKDYTDALFYTMEDGQFEVIVRKEMIVPFLLQAFRFRCIESLSWK
jgi:hypothetical protein